MSTRTSSFVKFRHKTLIFTRRNIAALQKSGALNSSDLISLVFLMCGDDQINEMFVFLSEKRLVASTDLYNLFRSFPDWERKLPVALVIIENELALSKLDISPNDSKMMANSASPLSSLRVSLYTIIDSLRAQNRDRFIVRMVEPDDLPPSDHPQLELDFMYWHSKGVLDITQGETLAIVAKTLEAIGEFELAKFASPQVVHGHEFDREYTLPAYEIKNEKNPGLCLIVNQVRYGGKERDRDSSLVNAENVCEVMRDLNYTVVTVEDLFASEFCNTVKAAVKKHFSNDHSIFVLIIMAHGEREGVMCPPEKMSLDKVDQSMSSAKDLMAKLDELGFVRTADIQRSLFECEELKRIPKVLLLNCCRGNFEFTTWNYFKMEADAPGDDHPLSSHVDIITCHSALPDFISWRDSAKGSPFLNTFCDILNRRPDMEVCEMFTLMNARLMQPTGDMSAAFKENRCGDVYKLAMPFDFTSCLTKKLYFKLPGAANSS